MLDKFSAATQKLRRLSSLEIDASGSYQSFLYDLLSEGMTVLDVSRVSVWLFDDQSTPKELFNIANTDWPQSGPESPLNPLLKEHFPSYFLAINQGHSIAASDATTDTRTSEFKEVYLLPNEIKTMLDTVIFKNGIPWGRVCFEGLTEVREWTRQEIMFAEMVADCCSRRLMVHQLWQMQLRLSELAFKDPLTELHNRRYLNDYAKREMSRHQRNAQPLSLIMLDMDHFKRVNDNFGHEVGDQVLQAMAKTCLSLLRAEDCMCRFGGEEFVILLPETESQYAVIIADRLRMDIEKQVALEVGIECNEITASFGVTEVDVTAPFKNAIKVADQAVYQAKSLGKNCVVEAYLQSYHLNLS